MGAQQSTPERVYNAVKKPNIVELKHLCETLLTQSNVDAAARRRYIEWTDPEGRTPLCLAAQKNQYQAAQLLLRQGADIYHVAPKRQYGGSALHEAVYNKHEAMVELLLEHNADPFLENGSGHTAMDLAVAVGSCSLVRMLERRSLFCGLVASKVPQMKGLASVWKDRWVVISPRYSLPTTPGVTTVRIMLWLFKDKSASEPRSKVWLDGATALTMGIGGLEGFVRLHANHECPKNVASKYDRGWLLFFKAATTLPSPQQAASEFRALIDTCNRPLNRLRGAGAAAPAPVAAVAAAAAAGYAWAPQRLASGASSSGSAWGAASQPSNAWLANVAAPPPAPAMVPPAAARTAVAAPQQVTSQPQSGPASPRQPLYPPVPLQPLHGAHSGLRMQPAPSPPPEATSMSHPVQLPANYYAEGLEAEPGESDEAFAVRLASITDGAGSPLVYGASPYGSHHGSVTTPRAGGGSGSGSSLHGSGSGLTGATGAAAHQRTPQDGSSGAAAGGTGAPRPAQVGGTLQRPVSAGGTVSTGTSDGGAPSAPPLVAANPFAGAPAAAPPGLPATSSSAPAAAGAAAAAAAAAGRAGSNDDDDERLCVICLSNPKQIGFMHGNGVHTCACTDCARLIQVGSPCPLCREPIERVLQVW